MNQPLSFQGCNHYYNGFPYFNWLSLAQFLGHLQVVQELRSSGETLARETKQQCSLADADVEFSDFGDEFCRVFLAGLKKILMFTCKILLVNKLTRQRRQVRRKLERLAKEQCNIVGQQAELEQTVKQGAVHGQQQQHQQQVQNAMTQGHMQQAVQFAQVVQQVQQTARDAQFALQQARLLVDTSASSESGRGGTTSSPTSRTCGTGSARSSGCCQMFHPVTASRLIFAKSRRGD